MVSAVTVSEVFHVLVKSCPAKQAERLTVPPVKASMSFVTEASAVSVEMFGVLRAWWVT